MWGVTKACHQWAWPSKGTHLAFKRHVKTNRTAVGHFLCWSFCRNGLKSKYCRSKIQLCKSRRPQYNSVVLKNKIPLLKPTTKMNQMQMSIKTYGWSFTKEEERNFCSVVICYFCNIFIYKNLFHGTNTILELRVPHHYPPSLGIKTSSLIHQTI